MNRTAEAERAAVVAWLRGQDEYSDIAYQLAANFYEIPDADFSWVFPFIADAIEAGDHIKQEKQDD